MALLSALFSIFHILLLLLIPLLTFLWIIGKLKELRLRNEHRHHQIFAQPYPQTTDPIPSPSPTNIPLEPRRLSFSSAATNTPTPPTANPKRRVTFSLTPEQQANELLKTAVRRRESLPSANLIVSQQSSPPQYKPNPQQVVHLFPSTQAPPFRYNPSAPRSVFPTIQQLQYQPQQYQHQQYQQSFQFSQQQQMLQPTKKSSPPNKRKTSPNKNQTPRPKRQRNPNDPAWRQSATPVYVADLRREPIEIAQKQFDDASPPMKEFNRYDLGRSLEKVNDDPSPDVTTVDADSEVLHRNGAKQNYGEKRRITPPSDKKPPKPPRLGTVPNGYAPQPQMGFPRDNVTRVRSNGVVSRSIR